MRRYLAWLPLVTLCGLAGCAGGSGPVAWNGRRGYDGNGDYGYDLNAERAEARQYRRQASRNYPVPGTQDDPWGPYIQEAAAQYTVPERWIREVMRQESGGRLQAADGSLTTSNVGAMGLMQVMPATYDILRRRYNLGDDPYEPHDNIMAGTAYIREMSDQFGAPGFLAAYNAGPRRLQAYLDGATELPDETINYVARIAPRLGTQVAMTGPLAIYATGARGGSAPVQLASADIQTRYAPPLAGEDRAYAGGGMSGSSYYSRDRGRMAMAAMPSSDAAATLPIPPPPPPSSFTLLPRAEAAELPHPRPAAASTRPAEALVALVAPGPFATGTWAVQVGAFPDPAQSRIAAQSARRASPQLAAASVAIVPVLRDGATLYRARLAGLDGPAAAQSCTVLQRTGTACFTVPPGS